MTWIFDRSSATCPKTRRCALRTQRRSLACRSGCALIDRTSPISVDRKCASVRGRAAAPDESRIQTWEALQRDTMKERLFARYSY